MSAEFGDMATNLRKTWLTKALQTISHDVDLTWFGPKATMFGLVAFEQMKWLR